MALSICAMMGFRLFAVLGLVAALLAAPAHAQEREVPYWASLRYGEVRMRVGPKPSLVASNHMIGIAEIEAWTAATTATLGVHPREIGRSAADRAISFIPVTL